ncbi:STM4015 family protein [Nocardiopsis synnemataformans]|uniref:STM4015 family protein n=1 Tax=Nocardiopsis synnemataformans TaxID=61305 RepID=UPI003EBD49B1
MTFHDHLTEFAGLPVASYPEARRLEEHGETTAPGVRSPERDGLADPGSVAWLFDEYGIPEVPREHLESFLEFVGAPASVRALVVGGLVDGFEVESSDAVRDALAEAAPRLPGLRSLFYADLICDECEASWIRHGDLSPLVTAFPGLTGFAVRGTTRLSLEALEHDGLHRLTLQGGGLPGRLAREVASARLPALEHLELWLGMEDYGGDTTAQDLAPVLSGEAFPGLRSLGLRNAEHTGAWVRVLAEAPVTSRLHTLDLSLGTLRDEDVPVLLESPVFRGLGKLDLHHHYLSEEAEKEVRAAFTGAGVEVDLSDREGPNLDTYDGEPTYYTAVSE